MSDIKFIPSVYVITNVPGRPYCRLERRDDIHRDVWAIVDSSFNLARDNIWEWEPSPSGCRDKEFISRTRYTFDEAEQQILKYVIAIARAADPLAEME